MKVFIGLCGEFPKNDIFLNHSYIQDNSNIPKGATEEQKKVWSIKGSGCNVISERLIDIETHQENHGGCDTLILEGDLTIVNSKISLIAVEK